MDKGVIFWQTYLNLENDLLDVSKYIFFTDTIVDKQGKEGHTDSQLNTFSSYLADLLVRICIHIEEISKELYFDFFGTQRKGDKSLHFDTDCLKEIDKKYSTSNKLIYVVCQYFDFQKEENMCFKPLKEAHKGNALWEKAYQAVKHYRFSSLSYGSVKNVIHALAALYLLNLYYKKAKLSTKYLDINKVDLSFGSKVFSVARPADCVIDVLNNGPKTGILHANQSPYILKYTNDTYLKVLRAGEDELQRRKDFYLSQPESSDPEFAKVISKCVAKEKEDPHQRFIFTWELCKYRLNKKIPQSLPFEERKRLFVSSNEWNGHLRLINKHLNEDELTEENIQSEIDHTGIMAGMELEQQLSYEKTRIGLYDAYCEIVIDDGNVKYPDYK